jgi:GH25 family lysozyme M1 (1,4-beta-N-acetylmuramidase)
MEFQVAENPKISKQKNTKEGVKSMKKIICFLFGHKWTCKADKGIQPTKEQLDNGVNGFRDYAKMYCDNCGKESKLNARL